MNHPKKIGSQPYTQPKPAGRPLPNPVVPSAPPVVNNPRGPDPYQPATSQPTDTGRGHPPSRGPASLPPSPSTSRPIDVEPK